MVNQGFAQMYEEHPKYSTSASRITSTNSIKEDVFYRLECAFENTCLASNLSGFKVIKRNLNGSFIISIDPSDLDSDALDLKSIALFETDNAWKKSSNITIAENEYLNGEYWLAIEDEQEWSDFEIREPRISTISDFGKYEKVLIQSLQLEHFLNKEFVTYIEKVSAQVKSEATVLDLNLHPNRINTIQAYLTRFDGSSEKVSIKEPFYNVSDIDIAGRYANTGMASEFTDSHALEMTTIIAGNGNSSLNGLGVAPAVIHTSSSNEEISPDPAEYFNSNAIQIQNHSYGIDVESFYGIGASLYDQQVYESPEILHVFSAGNSGLESAAHGKFQGLSGYSNITGNSKLAKNVLTIGAVDTTMKIIPLNSNGPSFDGRIKPELVAYSMAGTSNSAAYVSGVSVLLQQSFRDKFNSAMPSSLVKAFLINSADYTETLGPDHKTGYGSLNAYKAMLQLEDEKFIQNDLVDNEEKKYSIAIPENAVNFKATLVWTDPPANPNDQIALINDLNIRVLDKNAQYHMPWVLSAEPNIESLSSAAVKGTDHLNNIEQVHIEKVESDTLEIIISTENPLESSQSFSIVYDWEAENDFSWTSPTFKDNIPYNGETVSHIRWESSYLGEQEGDLYFKLIHESDWSLIEEDISLRAENYRWDPEMVNDFAQLKMAVGDKSYISDTFSISEPLRLNVGFNCTDSLSFYWSRVDQVDDYALFNLQGTEMKLFERTQDTVITIHKSDLSSSFLKIQAFKNDKSLIQGRVIDYNLQASNCFLQSYFVEAIQGNGIKHSIRLSSFSGVDKIQIQKKDELNDSWNALAEIKANSFSFEFLEEGPNNGFNESRVIIYLNNGQTVLSEIQSTYFVTDDNFILYPNPLVLEEDLKVFAKEAKNRAEISFYNMQGLHIISFPVPNDRNFVDLSSLREGLYIYRIKDTNNQYDQGKILIRN
ncbi:S8 family peptidase [Marivirga sericea]|nr:S8 family peptidase [Marivirga sericea]